MSLLKTAIQAAIANKIQRPLPKMACVLSNGRNTVVGFNKRKSHPLQLKFNPQNPKAICLHAEMDAIRQALKLEGTSPGTYGSDLSGYKMYVARVLRDNTTACAKPCEGCQGAIISFNIKTVEWTE